MFASQFIKGGCGANRARWATLPPSDPVPACQVTLQVTYGDRRANHAN